MSDQRGKASGSRGRGGGPARGNKGGERSGGERGRRSSSPRQPVGLDRAVRTPGAPPRAPRTDADAPPRPDLPDVEPDLPRGVKRELQRNVADHARADEAAVALTIASEALEDEDGAAALPYAEWVRHLAPRSPSAREALGVARYLTGDFGGALTELQAYRRLTDRPDQNHVIADCLRAVGRSAERIPALVEEMRDRAPEDRVTEGMIVWASSLADGGDVPAGRAVLRRRMEELPAEVEEHHLRLWYVAGDLAERAGDRDEARRLFVRIVDGVDEPFFDAAERAERLRERGS